MPTGGIGGRLSLAMKAFVGAEFEGSGEWMHLGELLLPEDPPFL